MDSSIWIVKGAIVVRSFEFPFFPWRAKGILLSPQTLCARALIRRWIDSRKAFSLSKNYFPLRDLPHWIYSSEAPQRKNRDLEMTSVAHRYTGKSCTNIRFSAEMIQGQCGSAIAPDVSLIRATRNLAGDTHWYTTWSPIGDHCDDVERLMSQKLYSSSTFLLKPNPWSGTLPEIHSKT